MQESRYPAKRNMVNREDSGGSAKDGKAGEQKKTGKGRQEDWKQHGKRPIRNDAKSPVHKKQRTQRRHWRMDSKELQNGKDVDKVG